MKEFSYKGEKFSFQWDPKEGIVFIKLWGPQEKKDAEEFKKVAEDFLEKFPEVDPAKMLVDCSEQGNIEYEARRIYTDAARLPRRGFVAVCGSNTIVRLIAGFLLAAAKRDSIRLFKNRESGLKWLKEINGGK